MTCRGLIQPEVSCDPMTYELGFLGTFYLEKTWPLALFSITVIIPSSFFLPDYPPCSRKVHQEQKCTWL